MRQVAERVRSATERVRSENALRESEEQFRVFAQAMPNQVWAATSDGELYWFNSQVYAYTGASLGDLHGADAWNGIVHPDDLGVARELWSRSLRTGDVYQTEFRMRRRDGAFRWFLVRAEPVRGKDGGITRWIGANTDIDDARRASERLERIVAERTAELRLFGDIIESNASPICTFDTSYRLIAFNSAHSDEFFRIFGHRVQLGEVFPDLFPPDQAAIIRGFMARALGGEAFTVTEEFGDPDLAKPSWEVAYTPLRDAEGVIIGAYHLADDISDRLRAEAELVAAQDALRQAQKMEAVGQLTGGIAHDFNNLLTGITGSLDLMLTRIRQGRLNDVERYVTVAQGAAKRAASLTHRLLAFSRRQTLDPQPTDVNRLVSGMEDLLRRTVGPAIEVDVVGAGGLWGTLVDPHQLENAILNLVINARDAMPDGGRITIETANRWLDGRTAKERELPPGQYLSVCVTDTGTGMSPTVIERAFEPFYTTKPLGQGTGLGLSMIYGFTRQSGGQVRIYSELGQGTTICLYLPRHLGEDIQPAAEIRSPDPRRATDGQTVMVVDDEATVRMLVMEVLEDSGYAAIEAGDGPSAMKVLSSNARIDLLITDVGLPGGMNGRQVADAARIVRPELKVMFITGYAENAAVGNGQIEPGMSVMTKPFDVAALESRIREILED
ncbi:PAS domain S-box protein [Chenggangzhangella methanolivorans]|uniref:hybrid sensor histidine kinase/response regulator n=1 Tax=Chenggangzhangella methanolivorans TaxID=1437009 RepID=UPI0036230692